jgi:hypothetical protein
MSGQKTLMPVHLSPRCSARSKRIGEGCRAPAVTEWSVCRFHGARGGGPKGKANGSYRHGRFTCEAIAQRQELSALVTMMDQFAKGLV